MGGRPGRRILLNSDDVDSNIEHHHEVRGNDDADEHEDDEEDDDEDAVDREI